MFQTTCKVAVIVFFLCMVSLIQSCQKPSSNSKEAPEEILSANAKAPSTSTSLLEWQKCIGSNVPDESRAFKKTSDGGYIIAANSQGNFNGDVNSPNRGGYDAWIIKLNSSGAIEWEETYGGAAYDWIIDIAETADGYVFCGTTSSFPEIQPGEAGAWVVKIDKSGKQLWHRVLGGSKRDGFNSIAVTSDGSIIAAGINGSPDNSYLENNLNGGNDAWVVKFNAAGDNIEWSKAYGGSLSETATAVIEENGGFIIGADTDSRDGSLAGVTAYGGRDGWVFKLDGNGDLVQGSSRLLGGSGTDQNLTILKNAPGGYVISAFTTSNDGLVSGNKGDQDAWVAKLDGNLNITSARTCLGGAASDMLRVFYIDENTKQIFLTGSTRSKTISGFKGDGDLWFVRLENDLKVLNSQAFGGASLEIGWGVAPALNGCFVLGRTESNTRDVSGNHGMNDVWLLKMKF